MSITVMKQALEALETATHQWEKEKAITSLRQAIAEAEKQEPLAYVHRNEYNEYRLEPTDNFKIEDLPVGVEVMLYRQPQPKREPLTDELVDALKTVLNWVDDFCETDEHFAESVEAKADAAPEKYEAAHGIKG